jgi:hypothetical protein
MDGDLDLLWDWLVRTDPRTSALRRAAPPAALPRVRQDNSWFESMRKPNSYWSSYPALAPFYPIPNPSPEWIDAWSMQDFHGYWW